MSIVGKKSVIYEPLSVYVRPDIVENPTYSSNVIQASGFNAFDCKRVIVPPPVGNVFNSYFSKVSGSVGISV